jgi:hypothetical protein
MVQEFGKVDDYDWEPVRSVYDYPLEALFLVPNVNDVVEKEQTSVEKDFYQRCFGWWHRRRRDLTLHRYFSLMFQ